MQIIIGTSFVTFLRAQLKYLHILWRLMDCSSSALILKPRIGCPASLSFHRVLRTIAVSRVMGRDMSSSTLPWTSRSTCSACMLGMYCCRQWTSLVPTSSFLLQKSSSCSSVPISVQPCILQTGALMVPILCSLDCVGRRLCSMRNRKLAKSGGIPG